MSTRLSGELYRTDTHFILEFIQNAEDNAYAKNLVPTLRIDVQDHTMTIMSNEIGFTEKNVAAICDIGKSTKKNIVGFIGEWNM